jgi:arylsulfatase A-like enzyme
MTPNIVLIVTDEERSGGGFESTGFSSFRKHFLPNHDILSSQGKSFQQHRCASTACTPSRACMFTGLPVWTHGVSQTDGLAKLGEDPLMVSLDPIRGPRTLGHHFQELGYETIYVGKWHLSHIDSEGLEPFGFGKEWIGPEPHGADPRNSGLSRDFGFVKQAVSFLDNRRRKVGNKKPFLLVVCLVNPHDVVFWASWWVAQIAVYTGICAITATAHWRSKGSHHATAAAFASSTLLAVPALRMFAPLNIGGVADPGPSPTEFQESEEDSSVIKEYRHAYFKSYGPAWFFNLVYRFGATSYRRSYLKLLAVADRHLGTLLGAVDALEEQGERTAVVFTSDHGDLLGAHGGLHQKWSGLSDSLARTRSIKI